MLKQDARNAVPIAVPSGFALWRLGFRPFYLVASAFAAVSILLWICQYTGHLPGAYFSAPAWHAHEMLYGFTLAVVAGFLLTAVPNWTANPTPKGVALALLVALWLAGRVLVFTPFHVVAAVVDSAFPVAVAAAIAAPLLRSRNRRNYFFIALLVVFGVSNLAFHLSELGLFEWPARASLQVGLDVILFVMVVMAGRVIPMFTNNGIPGVNATRRAAVEKLALGGVLLLLALDLVRASPAVTALIALCVAGVHAVRLLLWQPWRTLATPLVWVLHLAYAWIVVHLLLRGLSAAGVVGEVFAVHALTIGAIGGLTIGMMTRTARGHTGRPLVADRFEVACYVLVALAAVTRVFGGMAFPDLYLATLVASAACWSAAYAIYAVRYWPILSRARLDGKLG
jgi:uncharacterized protein involved in response to NO